MEIDGKVAVITGAASGIGQAAAKELHRYGTAALALVDVADGVHEVAAELCDSNGGRAVRAFQGDTTDATFRHEVYASMRREHGAVNICVPAAGITRDDLAVRINNADVVGSSPTMPIIYESIS